MTKIQKTMFIGKHFPKKTFITYLCIYAVDNCGKSTLGAFFSVRFPISFLSFSSSCTICSSRAAFLLMLGDGDRRNEK